LRAFLSVVDSLLVVSLLDERERRSEEAAEDWEFLVLVLQYVDEADERKNAAKHYHDCADGVAKVCEYLPDYYDEQTSEALFEVEHHVFVAYFAFSNEVGD
jgi:hypothetical protein